MSRMIEALKVLENRRQANVPSESFRMPERLPVLEVDSEFALGSEPVELNEFAATTPDLGPHQVLPVCTLPTSGELHNCYHKLAWRISEQLASNYCNVSLFVSPDHGADAGFSMTHLTQAVVLQSAGDVLLIDGDLRRGRLSKSVCPSGPGMIEAMLGLSAWPEIIHRTTMPSIDFVACGIGQVPTLERARFGWEALRPKYRAVLIGVASAQEPETAWLAARCDAVYMVVSRTRSHRSAASSAVNGLRACGANLLGCIVTDD